MLKGCFAASGTCDLYKVDGIMKNLRVLKQNLKPSSRAGVGSRNHEAGVNAGVWGILAPAKSVLCQKTEKSIFIHILII